MLDIVLLILAILCLLVGFAGAVLPILPGPQLSWVALLLLKFSSFGENVTWLWIAIFAAIVIVVVVLDYYVPIWGTKKFGGTRAGMWGATIGLIIGLFFSPVGIILGPFLGALLAELLAGNSKEHSLRAAFGAFIGFLFGVGLKLIACFWITVYFVIVVVF